MLLLGHRGASAEAPENTLPAFALAIEQGADGVELDAMVCGSGEVVVCHDEVLDRLAGVSWEVRATPLRRLRTLDIGAHLGFGSAAIPLLSDVFEQLPQGALINVELKCDRADDGGLCERVCRLVDRHRLSDRVLISSFNPLCLLRVAAHAPELRRGYLIDPDSSFLRQAASAPLWANHSVHPHYSQCTKPWTAAWKGGGLELAPWTVDSPEEARRLSGLGAAYCITNRPGSLRRALEERT